MLFRFFQFLFYVYFNVALVKNFMGKLSFFNTNFQISFQDVVYYRISKCQVFWYLNGGPLNIRQNLIKRLLLFRSKIGVPIKWRPFNFFAKLHETLLLIANIVKDAVSGLTQFLTREGPWKIMKSVFYFTLETLCVLKIFKLLSLLFVHVGKKAWLEI